VIRLDVAGTFRGGVEVQAPHGVAPPLDAALDEGGWTGRDRMLLAWETILDRRPAPSPGTVLLVMRIGYRLGAE
jgi:hypothetical protein